MDATKALLIKPLSNFDIDSILKDVDNFRGVFSKDMLPQKILDNESVVINIQDYLDGGGTHWVCVVNQPDSADVEYFDSFGVQPSDVVVDYMTQAGKGVVYSDGHIQDVRSVMCGYYACYFIMERFKGRPMVDVLLDFSKPEMNEKMITAFAQARVGGGVKPELKWKDQLAVELHRPVKRKFKRRRVIANGVDDIWSADLVDMQWNSRENKGYKYLLNVIDVFSKYAWSLPIKDKTGKTITDTFQKLSKTSGRKPKMLWVDQGTEFYNRVFRSWLKDRDIEMYSVHNEGKAVVVERFNRTLKEWMWKYFSANNTHKYIDIIDTLVSLYNAKYHSSVKMKPKEASLKKNEARVYKNLYGDVIEPPETTSNFEVGDSVRISKKKAMFEKGYTPRWTEEIFKVYEVQMTNPVTYKLEDLNGEKIDGSFYEAELQKTTQDVFRIEKILRKDKKNGMALVKWRGYSSKFNSWVPLDSLERISKMKKSN